jgi:hypothetical protein
MAITLSLSLFLSSGCLRGFLSEWDLDFNFNFDISLDCMRGELEWSCMGRLSPVATGASWELAIEQAPEGATLVSDTPAVLSVQALGNRRYAVRAVTPGNAQLQIITLDGAVFDAAELVVRDAVSLELIPFECRRTRLDSVELVVGDSCHLMAVFGDAHGNVLFAGTNPEWSPAHPAHIDFFQEVEADLLPYGPIAIGTGGPFMRLDAIAEGSTSVACSLGGVTAMRTIHVSQPATPDASMDEPDASMDEPDASSPPP